MAKKGFAISGINTPMLQLSLPLRFLATALGTKLFSAITDSTNFLVSFFTEPPLITRDTVAMETPASLAMS